MLPKHITLSRFFAESAKPTPCGRIYPRLRDDVEIDDLASPEKFEMEDTLEKVRSGEGQDEIAGVGDTDGDGEESRASLVGDTKRWSIWSPILCGVSSIFAGRSLLKDVVSAGNEMVRKSKL